MIRLMPPPEGRKGEGVDDENEVVAEGNRKRTNGGAGARSDDDATAEEGEYGDSPLK